jgi:hypothetical protein
MTGGSGASSNIVAFPRLDTSDLAALAPLADLCSFEDGQTVFRAGEPIWIDSWSSPALSRY